MKTVKHQFSLIELLIVIGILGALLTLVLPGFNDTSEDAKDKVARTEMKEIQKQFQRFYADNLNELRVKDTAIGGSGNTNRYLRDIALYGVWPLLSQHHPVLNEVAIWDTDGTSFKKYDVYGATDDGGQPLKFGWHGPYLELEGTVAIDTPVLTYAFTTDETTGNLTITQAGGQTRKELSDNKIPVIRDPFGGYYRVLCPEARTDTEGNNLDEYERLKRLVLVCTGPNRKLDTATNNFIPKEGYKARTGEKVEFIKSINGDDLMPGGDDILIRLMPTAF